MSFNYIPGNLVAPIVTFEISSGGQFENPSRLLLIGYKNTGASLVDNTPTPCPTPYEARALAGAGSMLDDMVRIARQNAPALEIWIMSPTAAGTANVRTLTFSAPAEDGGQGVIWINGEPVSVTLSAGATDEDAAAAIAAAINAYYNPLTEASLPVTATVAAEVVTVTNRHGGAHGAEIDIYVPQMGGANALYGAVAVATTTAGSGSPDLSTGLAAMGDDAFDWIVTAFADDTNLGRLETLLSDVSGRWAWNRQIYGHAFYAKVDTVGNLTTHGLAKDTRHLSCVPLVTGDGHYQASYLWAAAIVARSAVWLADGANGNVSRNQTGLAVAGILAPRDRAKWLAYATRDAFLKSGLSTWSVDGGGNVVIDKIITMQRTTAGVTDTTFRDIQKIGQITYGLRYLRQRVTIEHGQKAIADDNPANLDSISTPLDIKATFAHAYLDLVRRGVFEDYVGFIDRCTVTRDADNPNRVNVMASLDAVNPLDVIATNAKIYSQFR